LAIFHILTELNYLSTLYVGTSVLRWAGWATVTYGRLGKLKTRVGKRIYFAPNFIKQMFAHPGLKVETLPRPVTSHLTTGGGSFFLNYGPLPVPSSPSLSLPSHPFSLPLPSFPPPSLPSLLPPLLPFSSPFPSPHPGGPQRLNCG